MKRQAKLNICLTALCCLLFTLTAMGSERDSLHRFSPTPQLGMQTDLSGEIGRYLQAGFRLGTDFLLTDRQISDHDYLENFLSGTFGFYARGGYEFIFGEIGLNYMFYKGYYQISDLNMDPLTAETVESRYLQIPISVVGYWQATKTFALIPKVGITYQPLIHVSKNDINYNKHTLTPHQFLYSAGVGIKLKFFTVEVAYKGAMKPFFTQKESVKQSFINLMVGFQF